MPMAPPRSSIACYVCKERTALPYTKKNGCELFRCSICGLIFVYPLPRSTEAIYEQDYFEGATDGFGYLSYDTDKEPMIPAFKKYLRHIDAALPAKGKLLDVGAATGFFVGLAGEAGFDAEGVDISDHAAALGRAKGLSMRTGIIDDMSGHFDAVTMLDVIEHVPDPRAVLSKAAALLRSGGVLVINTPDVGSFVARVLGRHWHAIIPPEHLYYFNRANMRYLLKEAGFEVAEVTTIIKSFTLNYICKTLHQSTRMGLFLKISSLCSRWPLSKISIPINLHDSMFVLARKK